MPSLDFVLPHWLYWVGLAAFPVIAMVLSRRARPRKTYSAALGWLILITGGILGLHRFYLKNLWGLIFLPLFGFILYANAQERDARELLSAANNLVRVAERTLDRERPRVEEAEASLPELRAELDEAEEGSFARRSVEMRLGRAEGRVAEGRERIERSVAELEAAQPQAEAAAADRAFWGRAARSSLYVILALMLVDAILMPWLVCAAQERLAREGEATLVVEALEAGDEAGGDAARVSRGWTGWIDRLSLYAGEFAAYWAVIAVFVYYYEVIARYVFNSPTSWAHEGMYLMFGMQYLIAGSYAMLTESHVRVDVFYAPLSARRKAVVDLFTSIFFFIFAGTLLVTSWIFAMDAIAVPSGNAGISAWARGQADFGEALGRLWSDSTDPSIRFGEISFNEWEVALWPMKFVMVGGAILLILQGVSKLAQDLRVVVRGA